MNITVALTFNRQGKHHVVEVRLEDVSLAPTATPALGSRFARELPELALAWQAEDAPDPTLLTLNEPLAAELGLDAAALRTGDGVRLLVGNAVPEGATPVAQAYAGHQFGGYSPRLGDGRALVVDVSLDLREVGRMARRREKRRRERR